MLVGAAIYRASGGHQALRSSVIDDIGLAIRIRRAGGRCRMVMADGLVRVRMYRGFRQIFDGFTKNLAYVFEGAMGAFLAVSTFFTYLAWSLPALVLVAAASGVPVPAGDVRLAGVAFLLTVVARAALGVYLRYPLWSAVTQLAFSTKNGLSLKSVPSLG